MNLFLNSTLSSNQKYLELLNLKINLWIWYFILNNFIIWSIFFSLTYYSCSEWGILHSHKRRRKKKNRRGFTATSTLFSSRLLWNWIMESEIFQLQWHWNRVSAMADGTESQVSKAWSYLLRKVTVPKSPSLVIYLHGPVHWKYFQVFPFSLSRCSLYGSGNPFPHSDTGTVECPGRTRPSSYQIQSKMNACCSGNKTASWKCCQPFSRCKPDDILLFPFFPIRGQIQR